MSQKIIWLLYLLLVINFCYVLVGAIYIPLQSVDVVGIWLFKAKAFFVEGGLPMQTLKNPDFLLFHPQYPVLLPFAYSLIYFLLGRVWELPILLLYPIYYLIILMLVFKVLRRMHLSALQSLTYTYIYSMFSPLLGQAGRMHAGSADIVIVLIAWIVIYLWQTIQLFKKDALINQSTWFITLLVMFASQIKLEGLFLAAVIMVLPLRKLKKIVHLAICLTPTLIWSYLVRKWELPVDFSFVLPTLTEVINRMWLIIYLTFREMFNVKNWYIFWPLLGISWMAQKSTNNKWLKHLVLVSLLMSGAYALVYLTVTTDVKAHITSSIDRVLFQLSPIIFPIFVIKSQLLLRRFADHPIASDHQIMHFFKFGYRR